MYFHLSYFVVFHLSSDVFSFFVSIYLKDIRQIRRTVMMFKNYYMVAFIKYQICAGLVLRDFHIYPLPSPKSCVVGDSYNAPLKKKKKRLRDSKWLQHLQFTSLCGGCHNSILLHSDIKTSHGLQSSLLNCLVSFKIQLPACLQIIFLCVFCIVVLLFLPNVFLHFG